MVIANFQKQYKRVARMMPFIFLMAGLIKANTYSGIVIDGATKNAISGVQISYKSSPLTIAAITNTKGEFAIAAASILPHSNKSELGSLIKWSIDHRTLKLNAGHRAWKTSIFNLRGQQISQFLLQGENSYTIPALSMGLYTLEIKSLDGAYHFRLFSMGAGNDLQLSESPYSDFGEPHSSPMAKLNASSTQDTLVFTKTGYTTKELSFQDSQVGLKVEMLAGAQAPKSLVFGNPFGSTMDIRGITGKEKVDVTKDSLSFTGTGSGGIMFFTEALVWDHTADYSEFLGMALRISTPVKIIVTIYTGSTSAADGSCTAIPDCGAKRYEVSAGTNGVVNFDFSSGTTLGNFDMKKFRLVAMWTGQTAVATVSKLEFTSKANGTDCSQPGYTLAKNEPPHCKAYVVIGQHADVGEYLGDNSLPAPAGIMTYWEEFGAGTAGSYAAVKAEESGMLVNVGVSLKQGAGCASDGANLKNWMGGYWDNTPVFLRVGYEIDNEHANCLGSIKSIFTRYRTTFANKPNVALVWHTSGTFQDNGTKRDITADFLESVWPGDAKVDWIGISYFTNNWQWKIGVMNVIIAFAKKHDKPIMLAEASVTDNSGVKASTIWDDFFELGLKSLIANPDNRIKMISYIATNWGANGWTQPFDTDTRFTGGGIIAQQKSKWVDMIEAKDLNNIFLNKKDIGITNGIIRVK
jgi:hypothetical protein